MRVSFPTRTGRNKLSTRPITSTPNAVRITPDKIAPVSRKYAATGAHTIPAPTAGNSDRNAISTAHTSALGISSTQKMKPPSAPWVMATSTLPFTVARTTRLNFSCKRRFWCSGSGTARRTWRATSAPSRRKKNNRYSMTKKLTMNWKVSCPKLNAWLASTWLPWVAHLLILSRSPSRLPMPMLSRPCWANAGSMSLPRST
ncbi:hypothetical protein D3C81_828270 [compost metagenome]